MRLILNKRKIIEELNKRKQELKTKGVKKIGLFGSYLHGKQKPWSDIDLIVTFDKITFDNHCTTRDYLQKIFKRKIDLIIDKELRKELGYVKKEAEYVKI